MQTNTRLIQTGQVLQDKEATTLAQAAGAKGHRHIVERAQFLSDQQVGKTARIPSV
jgi:hypothetical protein